MKLLVGLGNPGAQYSRHRHNAGFMVLDLLHDRAAGSEWREKFVGLAARGVLAGREVTLLKPQTFMNLSGRSVQRAAQQLGVRPQDILVVHDELDLAFGDVRAKQGGGHGGHNGLRDITAALGPDYARVRVGIGRPAVGTVEHFVLTAFSSEEAVTVPEALGRAADIVERAVAQGIDAAMNQYNHPKAPGGKKK
jgi:PTH1 family peptidyl-tRNA hydrolase